MLNLNESTISMIAEAVLVNARTIETLVNCLGDSDRQAVGRAVLSTQVATPEPRPADAPRRGRPPRVKVEQPDPAIEAPVFEERAAPVVIIEAPAPTPVLAPVPAPVNNVVQMPAVPVFNRPVEAPAEEPEPFKYGIAQITDEKNLLEFAIASYHKIQPAYANRMESLIEEITGDTGLASVQEEHYQEFWDRINQLIEDHPIGG